MESLRLKVITVLKSIVSSETSQEVDFKIVQRVNQESPSKHAKEPVPIGRFIGEPAE